MTSLLLETETELTGHWLTVSGKLVADDTCGRIQQLIGKELVKLARDSSGWGTLYRDPQDSRLWELSYPRSEMHGGGPPKLTCIHADRAMAIFGHAGD
jgi:Immunity protein 27